MVTPRRGRERDGRRSGSPSCILARPFDDRSQLLKRYAIPCCRVSWARIAFTTSGGRIRWNATITPLASSSRLIEPGSVSVGESCVPGKARSPRFHSIPSNRPKSSSDAGYCGFRVSSKSVIGAFDMGRCSLNAEACEFVNRERTGPWTGSESHPKVRARRAAAQESPGGQEMTDS